jgi:hypothetical protein
VRAMDFLDQPMGAKEGKCSGNRSGLPALFRRRCGPVGKDKRPQVSVAEPVDDELAPANRLNDPGVLRRIGVQGANPATVPGRRLAHPAGKFAQAEGVIDRCQSLQIALVGRLAARRCRSAIPLRSQALPASGRPSGARKDLNPEASLIVVSTRSTLPCLSYILIEFPPSRCLILTPSGRVFMSLTTSASSRGGTAPAAETLRPRKRITSGLRKVTRP